MLDYCLVVWLTIDINFRPPVNYGQPFQSMKIRRSSCSAECHSNVQSKFKQWRHYFETCVIYSAKQITRVKQSNYHFYFCFLLLCIHTEAFVSILSGNHVSLHLIITIFYDLIRLNMNRNKCIFLLYHSLK